MFSIGRIARKPLVKVYLSNKPSNDKLFNPTLVIPLRPLLTISPRVYSILRFSEKYRNKLMYNKTNTSDTNYYIDVNSFIKCSDNVDLACRNRKLNLLISEVIEAENKSNKAIALLIYEYCNRIKNVGFSLLNNSFTDADKTNPKVKDLYNYVQYLTTHSVKQELSLDEMYVLAYSYITENHPWWLL